MKKAISILLTVALILSLTPFGTLNVFAADMTEPIKVTSGDVVLDEGVNVNVTNALQAVHVENKSSSIKVNGNVSLIHNDSSLSEFIYGVEVKAALADITGDISVESAYDAKGIQIGGYSENPGSIYVGGNVSVKALNNAFGITANPNIANVTIGKDVIANGYYSVGLDLNNASGKMTIEGNVIADTNLYDDGGNVTTMRGDSIGVVLEPWNESEADIKGNIISNGSGAAGVVLGNYTKKETLSFSAEKDIIVKSSAKVNPYFDINSGIMLYNNRRGDINADIKGDIKLSLTEPDYSGAGIGIGLFKYASVSDDTSVPVYNNVHVHGDVISDDAGIYVKSLEQQINNIIIEGTLDAVNKGISVSSDGQGDINTNLTVWKIIPDASGNISAYNGGENDGKPVTTLESKINYIIRKEQPAEGGTFTVVKEDGTAIDQVEGLDVAHENEKVYIIPEEGYELKAAYYVMGEDKVELTKDIGGYYAIIPKGGGVNICVDLEELPKPTPEPTPTPEVTPNPESSATPDASAAPEASPSPSTDDITKEIPFAENIPVEEKQQVIEKANTDKNDVAGSTMKYLSLKAAKVKKDSIKLSWKKVKGADGYIIYGNKCGKKMKYITTIRKGSASSYTAKKLKKNTYYKYMVVAYKSTASGDKVITTSKSVHAATEGGKKGNPTTLKVKKSKFTLKKGKTARIKAGYKKKKKVSTHIAKFRYESFDEGIARVDKKGKIKAVSKGKTKILVYTQNGLSKTITVTVSK